ncbi:hypothetical protein Tco_0213749 [Tanacetum coccineum]
MIITNSLRKFCNFINHINDNNLSQPLAESGPPMLDLDGEDLDLTERNLKQCKRKICDGHYTAAVRVLSSSGVAPYNDATLQELKAKHPFMSAPSLRDSHIDHHPLIASQDVVLDRIKSFPRAAVAISDELVSSITQVVNLFLEGNCPTVLGGYIASAPLTPLVKPGGGIRPIAVGWYYLEGVRSPRSSWDEVCLSMHLVGLSKCLQSGRPNGYVRGSPSNDVLLYPPLAGDTLVVGKVLELITEDGPRYGLHLKVDKTELFCPKEDPPGAYWKPHFAVPIYYADKLLSEHIVMASPYFLSIQKALFMLVQGVFIEDIYGDQLYHTGKEVDIGLDGGHDKKLRPADMLLYSWDGGLDVCVDLTGSSPLTQTGMSDFAPGRAVTDAAQRKRGKYMTKCADIGYGFLPFSFSSFGELEKDAVTLLKRVRNFSMAQDIGARAASHIFNRIGFSIAKGVGAQIVSRLPSNVL